MRLFLKVFLFLLFGLGLVSFSFAQTPNQSLSPERRAELERQLSSLESQIAAQQKILDERKNQSSSLERDIAILNAEIQRAKLSIQARNLTIQKLSSEINGKQKTIGVLSEKLDRERESLSQILRKTYEIDDYSLVEFALSGEKTISEFFIDLDSFEEVKESLQASLGVVTETRDETQDQKEVLEEKKQSQAELLHIQELEKKKIEQQEREKQAILKESKGIEAEYQKILIAQQQTATQIRNELFQLVGSAAIPFETAYKYAKEASAMTGVRPALILGVLRQETNLGENIGQCLLTNVPSKGDGKGKNTGRFFAHVMKPNRDVDPFMDITRELGIDPFSQPVSCPQSIGYGGAMGPAQFIPSTWILYKDEISRLTGHNPPNPWQARVAIFATALLMEDNGAAKGTRAAERTAAMRYFGGWSARESTHGFYATGVLGFADKYQADINILEGR